MNKTTSALKVISCLAGISLLGLGIFAGALALGYESLPAFAGVASALLLLGAVRDYSPRRARWEPSARRTPVAHFPAHRHVIRRRASALVTAA